MTKWLASPVAAWVALALLLPAGCRAFGVATVRLAPSGAERAQVDASVVAPVAPRSARPPQVMVAEPRPMASEQVVLVQEAPASPTPLEPPAKSSDPADSPVPDQVTDPIAEARAIDEIAFESDYLRQKERLFPDHAGQWIAIVGGRLLPVDEKGRLVPTPEFAKCLAAADAADPAGKLALHRFLFRIGEEGDVVYADASASPRNVIGTGFHAALAIRAVFEPKSNELRWTRGDQSRTFTLDHDRLELLLSDPGGKQSMGVPLADSSSFPGFLALEATFATLLDAHRFEIPGRVLLRTPSGFAELRRARLRVKETTLALDELVPIAAWPR